MSAFTVLAAMAAAATPPPLAPPSFEGNDWLYVVNLFIFPLGMQIFGALFLKLCWDHWACLRAPVDSPNHDAWHSPIQVLRRTFIFISAGFALRCFSETQSLWRWYTLDPTGEGRNMALKRMLDPIAFGLGTAGVAIFFLSLPGLTEQLRKRPFPISMWTSLPLLKRPAGAVLCFFGAAVAVVVFR